MVVYNCLEGFLCEACNGCPFWCDGSDNKYGCAYPGPIEHCKPFKKVFDEWEETSGGKGNKSNALTK